MLRRLNVLSSISQHIRDRLTQKNNFISPAHHTVFSASIAEPTSPSYIYMEAHQVLQHIHTAPLAGPFPPDTPEQFLLLALPCRSPRSVLAVLFSFSWFLTLSFRCSISLRRSAMMLVYWSTFRRLHFTW